MNENLSKTKAELNRNKGSVDRSTTQNDRLFQRTKNQKMKKKWEEEGKLSAIYAGDNYRMGKESVQWQHNWSKQIMVEYSIHRLHNNHFFTQNHIASIFKKTTIRQQVSQRKYK